MGDQIIGAAWGSLGTVIAALFALLGIRMTSRSTRAAAQDAAVLEKRRDTITDRDALIEKLFSDAKQLRGDLGTLRERVDRLEAGVDARDAHIQALRDQIYRGTPPPPVQPPIPY